MYLYCTQRTYFSSFCVQGCVAYFYLYFQCLIMYRTLRIERAVQKSFFAQTRPHHSWRITNWNKFCISFESNFILFLFWTIKKLLFHSSQYDRTIGQTKSSLLPIYNTCIYLWGIQIWKSWISHARKAFFVLFVHRFKIYLILSFFPIYLDDRTILSFFPIYSDNRTNYIISTSNYEKYFTPQRIKKIKESSLLFSFHNKKGSVTN